MNTRIGALAVLTAALTCTSAAEAAPTQVKVRVEGATRTLFEGTVATGVHSVDGGDGTGAHKCDGTNGGANKVPGPTATGALADALTKGNLGFAAKYDASFEDFIVNKIGPDAASSSKFWGVAIDGKALDVGGCQAQVKAGQEVLWGYDLFNMKHILLLRGPRKVRVGKLVKLRVVDGKDGSAVSGAKVAGKTTNAAGIVKLRYRTTGTRRLKARRADSLRSNQLAVKVVRAH